MSGRMEVRWNGRMEATGDMMNNTTMAWWLFHFNIRSNSFVAI